MERDNEVHEDKHFENLKLQCFFDFIKKIEIQNEIIAKQNQELENIIKHVSEENAILESSIKELIVKDKDANWVSILNRK